MTEYAINSTDKIELERYSSHPFIYSNGPIILTIEEWNEIQKYNDNPIQLQELEDLRFSHIVNTWLLLSPIKGYNSLDKYNLKDLFNNIISGTELSKDDIIKTVNSILDNYNNDIKIEIIEIELKSNKIEIVYIDPKLDEWKAFYINNGKLYLYLTEKYCAEFVSDSI